MVGTAIFLSPLALLTDNTAGSMDMERVYYTTF